jgi:solute carrier family 44 protein 1 (choline transporter-like protein)/choline transporter-like protein 2/4/5
MWYFCQADNKTPDSPVSRSFVRGGFWHIGSIAFAAFVVAVVEMIRIIIAYFEARMRSVTQGNNAANWLVGCVDCCLACFERFIRFISRHAFVQIAMRSEGFCKAAQESFFLMLRYAAQFGLVHGIGSLFASIGNIFITALATFFGYYIVMHDYSGQVYSWIVPCVVFLFVSYIIAHVFMNVYGVSADAIVHCYCMDEEIHDTVKHAPPLLREFVDTHAPKQ